MSLINTLMGSENKQVNGIIAGNALAGAKSTAMAYLTACLESATPEVRNLFFTNCTQVVQGHQAMVELALKKGWYKPYLVPEEQLGDIFRQSQNFTQPQA